MGKGERDRKRDERIVRVSEREEEKERKRERKSAGKHETIRF